MITLAAGSPHILTALEIAERRSRRLVSARSVQVSTSRIASAAVTGAEGVTPASGSPEKVVLFRSIQSIFEDVVFRAAKAFVRDQEDWHGLHRSKPVEAATGA